MLKVKTKMKYQLNENIHKFTFDSEGREAVDEWAQEIERIQLEGHWYGQPLVRLLLDARDVADVPVRYLFECLSDYNREYEQLMPPRVRLAYIHNAETPMLSIFHTFATLLSTPVDAAFFSADEVESAWEWINR